MKLQKIGRKQADRQKDQADLSASRLLLAIRFTHLLPYRVKDWQIERIQEPVFDRRAREGVAQTIVRTFRQATETHPAVYGVWDCSFARLYQY